MLKPHNALDSIDVRDRGRVEAVMGEFRSRAVINAAGIVKQRPEAENFSVSREVSARFPHRLARQCRVHDARLLHVSTDCVFSGEKGNYTEFDCSDSVKVYGCTWLAGEVEEPDTISLFETHFAPDNMLAKRETEMHDFAEGATRAN